MMDQAERLRVNRVAEFAQGADFMASRMIIGLSSDNIYGKWHPAFCSVQYYE